MVLGFLVLGLQAVSSGCGAEDAKEQENTGFKYTLFQGIAEDWGKSLYNWFVPLVSFAQDSGHETYWILQEQIDSLLPFYGYYTADMDRDPEGADSFREILLAEAEEGSFREEEEPRYINMDDAEGQSLEELLRDRKSVV